MQKGEDTMSGEILCNDKLRFTYPEGFYEMTEEELSSLNVLEEGPGSVITDPQRHIIASFGWKPMGGISFLIVNTKDVFNGMRKQILEPMTAYGVRDGGAITRQLDGEAAEGFCYEYTAGDPCAREHCFHCVCTVCGKLYHVECDYLGDIAEHLSQEHGFSVDPQRTVFYGVCKECRAKREA